MQYYWRGRKPLHVLEPVAFETDGRFAGRPTKFVHRDIGPGEAFEPHATVLQSFGDLLEPVGASLVAPSPPLVESVEGLSGEPSEGIPPRGGRVRS